MHVVKVTRVKLDSGGYALSGAYRGTYFGVGYPVFRIETVDCQEGDGYVYTHQRGMSYQDMRRAWTMDGYKVAR